MSTKPSPFFSIVVPVFNAADRLAIMVNGLEAQTCQDFEVIFVNDQSTDNSLATLQSLTKGKANYHILELDKNVGAGEARNRGMDVSRGEYLHFHDADDWLDKRALAYLKEHLADNQYPDLCIFQYSIFDPDGSISSKLKRTVDQFSSDLTGKEVYQAICEGTINPAVWNKTFRREAWVSNNLRFQLGCTYEDLAFMPFACLKMARATFCSQANYCYFHNPNGVTYVLSDRQVFAPIQALDALSVLLSDDQEWPALEPYFIRLAFSTFRHNFFYTDRNRHFSDDQVLGYASNFFLFCQKHSLTTLDILNNDKALDLIEGLLAEKHFRRLQWKNLFSVSFDEIEGLVAHYMVITRQLRLTLANSGELTTMQQEWLKKENKLRRKIQQLKSDNERLRGKFFNRFISSIAKRIKGKG